MHRLILTKGGHALRRVDTHRHDELRALRTTALGSALGADVGFTLLASGSCPGVAVLGAVGTLAAFAVRALRR